MTRARGTWTQFTCDAAFARPRVRFDVLVRWLLGQSPQFQAGLVAAAARRRRGWEGAGFARHVNDAAERNVG